MDKSVQNASTLIIINVIDENDNSPVFLHHVYFTEVEERVLPQGVIGTIKAIDKDSGRNGSSPTSSYQIKIISESIPIQVIHFTMFPIFRGNVLIFQ